jgi:hypothetical protein
MNKTLGLQALRDLRSTRRRVKSRFVV